MRERATPCFCAEPVKVLLAPERCRLFMIDPCFSCQLAGPYTAVAPCSPQASLVMSACCLLALRAKHCPPCPLWFPEVLKGSVRLTPAGAAAADSGWPPRHFRGQQPDSGNGWHEPASLAIAQSANYTGHQSPKQQLGAGRGGQRGGGD